MIAFMDEYLDPSYYLLKLVISEVYFATCSETEATLAPLSIQACETSPVETSQV